MKRGDSEFGSSVIGLECGSSCLSSRTRGRERCAGLNSRYIYLVVDTAPGLTLGGFRRVNVGDGTGKVSVLGKSGPPLPEELARGFLEAVRGYSIRRRCSLPKLHKDEHITTPFRLHLWSNGPVCVRADIHSGLA